MILENTKRFISHEFHEGRIESESRFNWFPIAVNQRTDSVRLIERQVMNLRDYTFNIGSLFSDQESGFTNQKTSNRILPYKNKLWNSITIELS